MDLGVRISDVLAFAASMLYAFWPLLVVAPLSARRSSRKGRLLTMLAAWLIAAAAGFFAFLTGPQTFRLMQEPLNSLLFVGTGAVLVVITVVSSRKPRTTI